MALLLQPPVRQPAAGRERELLLGDEVYATTLLTWLIENSPAVEDPDLPGRTHPACFDWAPKTVRLEASERLGRELPEANFDRLMAAIVVVTTDLFFRDAYRFTQLANVLAFSPFRPADPEPADSVECAWAITEAYLLNPPEPGQEESYFSDDVRHYISQVLRDEGYVRPPDVLRIALDADFSDQVRYNFSDDPELFASIEQTQLAKADEVNTVIREGLSELFDQLQVLRLARGDARDAFNQGRPRSREQHNRPDPAHAPQRAR